MKLYFLFAKNMWDEIMTYRLNFIMWRFRMMLQLVTTYFLWSSLITSKGEIFGYTQSAMLTYVFGTAIIAAIVLSTRTHEIGETINNGNLSIFLTRPINYFSYLFSKDLGDKAMNIAFSFVEITILYFLVKPPIMLQENGLFIVLAGLAIMMGSLVFFFLSTLIGMLGFWTREVWGPRFILFILLQFFAGSLFPLDILPKQMYEIFQLLPFTYLLYFPMKVYLGSLAMSEVVYGFTIAFVWVCGLAILTRYFWRQGLRVYEAEGR